MTYFRSIFLMTMVILLSLGACAQQQPLPQPVNAQLLLQQEQQYADSIQRILLQDSLGLSDAITAQVLTTRHNYDSLAGRLGQNASLNATQRRQQLQALRSQTIETIRQLMGAVIYDRYMRLIMGQ